jgi:hypothetical protein
MKVSEPLDPWPGCSSRETPLMLFGEMEKIGENTDGKLDRPIFPGNRIFIPQNQLNLDSRRAIVDL